MKFLFGRIVANRAERTVKEGRYRAAIRNLNFA